MTTGIRAEVRVDATATCPVARLSVETDASIHSVSKSVSPEGTVTEEFIAESEGPIGDVDGDVAPTEVFRYGSSSAYRIERELGVGCPCERIEAFGCPVIDVRARDGALYLTFHAPDMATLQAIIGELREQCSGLDVRRLLRSREEYAADSLVFVDRSALTDRQREVLETAHRMGYFDHPKGANAGEVAAALDITTSTFTEHLSAAQRKLLGAVIDA